MKEGTRLEVLGREPTSPAVQTKGSAKRLMKPIAGLIALLAICLATTCSTSTAIAITPATAEPLETVADSIFATVAQTVSSRGLKPYQRVEQKGFKACFAKENLFLCGKVNDPEIHLLLYQTGTTRFSPWADSLRHELVDNLRRQFGESRVRECKWQTKRDGCPPVAGDSRRSTGPLTSSESTV